MKVRNVLSGTAMVALIVISVMYMTSVGLSFTDNVGVKKVTMMVPATNGLVEGSRVLLRGVSVGKVTDITTSVDGVEVQWNYSDDVRIPADSTYRVDNLSALGEAYVSVLPNSSGGPGLSDNVVLAAADTHVPTTLDELSEQLTILLEQIGEEQVGQIVGEINVGFVEDAAVLGSLARAGALLETTMLSTRGDFTTLLDTMQPILAEGGDIGPFLRASGDPTMRFGQGLGKFLDYAVPFIIDANVPTTLIDGVGPFLEDAQLLVDKIAPDLLILGDAVLPSVTAASASLKTVDLAQLLDTALSTRASGSTVKLHVAPN